MRGQRHNFGVVTQPVLATLVATAILATSTVQACCRNYDEYAEMCRSQGGIPSPNPARCEERAGNSNFDNGAARRAQEAAAEEQRQRQAELERIERERQAEAERVEAARLAEEKRRREAEFIVSRDATVLKGGIGTSAAPNDTVLKGSNAASVETKSLRGSEQVGAEQGRNTAWKQLHCAAQIAGFAATALQQRGDYVEFGTLSVEAMKALDGQRVDVVCTAAPPFPNTQGRAVNMDKIKAEERKIIERTTHIAERMKQRSDQPLSQQQDKTIVSPATAPHANETAEEKLRRVQRELNQVNSQKVTGTTKAKIDEQETDRKELAKLILANNQLEKGEFTSMSVDIAEEDAPPPRTKPNPAASTAK